jgi:hypothetical protein
VEKTLWAGLVRRRKLGQENAWKFELKLDSLGEKLRKKERGGGRERSRGSRGTVGFPRDREVA